MVLRNTNSLQMQPPATVQAFCGGSCPTSAAAARFLAVAPPCPPFAMCRVLAYLQRYVVPLFAAWVLSPPPRLLVLHAG